MLTQDKIVLWRIWGEFFNYPTCCIEAFVTRVGGAPSYTKQSPFYCSGFIACPSCHEKTKNMGVFQATAWLGRNPFAAVCTKDAESSRKWRNIAKKYQ